MKLAKSLTALTVLIAVFFSVYASAETTGKDIFLKSKCNQCHAIKAQGVESKMADKFPDLSTIADDSKLTKEFLTKFLQKEADLNGKKHAIKFKGEEGELGTLVDWILTLKSTK